MRSTTKLNWQSCIGIVSLSKLHRQNGKNGKRSKLQRQSHKKFRLQDWFRTMSWKVLLNQLLNYPAHFVDFEQYSGSWRNPKKKLKWRAGASCSRALCLSRWRISESSSFFKFSSYLKFEKSCTNLRKLSAFKSRKSVCETR